MGILAGLLLMAATGALERPTVTFYVSPDGNDAADGSAAHPVKTIPQAVKLTRGVLSDAKREIVVRDGLYPVLEPVVMDENDVDLTIRAEHSRKATLTGAIRLGGWRPDPEDARFLVADLPFEPEYGMSYALTSSGTNCPVACWPEKGRMKYESVVDQMEIAYPTNAFPTNFALGSIALRSVWLELPQEWATTRTLIATNDVASRRFALKSKANMSFKTFNHGFLMMNARVGLVKPGTWMYEAGRKRVVYWPREGERAETLDCRITATGTIFYLLKTPNVTIRGFVIEGCASSFTRNHPYTSMPVLGSVFVYWTTRTTIEDCEVRDSAANGIYAVKPHYLTIRKCHVHHHGSGGIDVFDGGDNIEILDNDVHDYGLTAASAVGVGMQAWGRCIGNHIHHGSGCGVVMWSVWSELASNELDHVMQKARDGGGLYGGQAYCRIHDNYVHDMWWPGLYNDEGGRDSIYYNNRFENCGWPIHMHATRRNVVSNNVFKLKGAMHLSFQGSGDCRFVDNKLYGPASMTNAAIVTKYVANCAEWARNELFDLQKDGSYTNCGLVTLTAPAGKPGGPIILPRTVEKDGKATPPKMDGKWQGDYAIKWQKVRGFWFFADGRPAAGGQPSCNLRQCADDDYVYLHFHQLYARLGPYPGLINLNHVWGKGDGVKVYLGDRLEVTLFFDGTIESNDPSLVFGKDDFAVDKGGWYNGNGAEVRIPLKAIGGGRGKTLKFNAVNYNEATRYYTWMFPPKGDDVRTGLLEFPAEDIKVLK